MSTSGIANAGAIAGLFDPYTRKARLYPVLLVVFPCILLTYAWFPSLCNAMGVIASLCVSFGVVLLLSQLARDRGKERESRLFENWDGKPSVALIRHADQRIDSITKKRYRAYLESKIPNLHLPTPSEERNNPARADAVYQSVTAWLLTQTRDPKKFLILFDENVSYGFRRNVWGLKPFGAAVSIVVAAVSTTAIIYLWLHQGASSLSTEVCVATPIAWLFPPFWFFVVSPSWVRVPADAYGRQLLASIDSLSPRESVATSSS